MKYLSALVAMLIYGLTLTGQDIHFSQFFAAPLTLNPARTAAIPEDYRIGLNFKNQWPWGSTLAHRTYRTFSIYGDKAFFREDWGNSWLGAGIVAVYDIAGDGNLATTKMLASAAYHIQLGFSRQWLLSLGLQGGYIQKRIDYSQLYFDSQWDDNRFNNSLPSGEPSGEEGLSYFDMGAGWSLAFQPDEKSSYYAGMGLLHMLKPKESFYDSDNRLGIRPVTQAGATIQFKQKWHAMPSSIWMYQKKAMELLASIMFSVELPIESKQPQSFWFGSLYRMKDAYIPVVGWQYGSIRALINYDINLSSLTEASRGVGGFELSIVYTGMKKSTMDKLMIPCPRM